MIFNVFLFILILAIVLFVSGFKYGSDLRFGSQVFHGVSAFLILFLGVIVLSNGVSFPDGVNITTSGNSTVVVDNYFTLKGGFSSFGLSYIFFFLGLMLSIFTYTRFNYADRRNFSEEDD
jgi:hypothetical protein